VIPGVREAVSHPDHDVEDSQCADLVGNARLGAERGEMLRECATVFPEFPIQPPPEAVRRTEGAAHDLVVHRYELRTLARQRFARSHPAGAVASLQQMPSLSACPPSRLSVAASPTPRSTLVGISRSSAVIARAEVAFE
jgi:hypothetical protein